VPARSPAYTGPELNMTFRSRHLQALLVCGVALTSRWAHADPSAAELSGARQSFESAVALEADQKWAEATVKLRAALAIKDTPGLRFHLAHCEEQQGFLVEAALDYDRASELLRQGAKAPDVQKLLAPASAELARRIPRVIVEIPNGAPSPVVELDGRAYAPSELALGQPLDPGSHLLKVSASGRIPFESSFSLREGDQISIVAQLPSRPAPGTIGTLGGAAVVAPPGGPMSPGARADWTAGTQTGTRSSLKLYLLIGESAVTVAGLAVGIGYSLAASAARDRVGTAQARIDQTAPDNTTACSTPAPSLGSSCTDLRTAISDHDRDVTLSTVGFIGAGVGAAALVTTWLVYPHANAETAGPAVEPFVALGGVGLHGRF
jgi:hypothetical protein